MILLLDPGGTRLKWAWMDGQELLEFGGASWPEAANQLSGSMAQAKLRYPSRSVSVHMLKRATPEQALQTGFPHWLNELVEGRWSELDPMALASFEVTYHDGNPGSDRISAAAACFHRNPSQSHVIIDAGTCITVDLMSKGVWKGGAILPGLDLQAQSMARAGLPVIGRNAEGQWPMQPGPNGALGQSTKAAIEAGISWATRKSVEATVSAFLELDPGAKVILTGGDAQHFDGLGGWLTFAHPNLVLEGAAALLNPTRT